MSGLIAWWLNGRLLRRRTFGLWQIKALNVMTPVFRADRQSAALAAAFLDRGDQETCGDRFVSLHSRRSRRLRWNPQPVRTNNMAAAIPNRSGSSHSKREIPYIKILFVCFLLTLPIVNPTVHGDGVGYYAYARALLIQQNLRFEEDWRHANKFFSAARIQTG